MIKMWVTSSTPKQEKTGGVLSANQVGMRIPPCRSRCQWVGLLVLLSGVALPAQAPPSDPTLWYGAPAPVWTRALPIGNGRMGAMVFGGANIGSNNGDEQSNAKNGDLLDGNKTRGQDEHLQLNEDSLWSGSRVNRLNPHGGEGFRKSRALLLESRGVDAAKITEAETVAEQAMIAIPSGMPPYSTLGDLYLRSTGISAVVNYRRELNLNTGIVHITYSADGAHFTREILASAPDHIMIIHLSSDRLRSVSFQMTMDRPSDFSVHTIGDSDLVLTEGPTHSAQIRFQGQIRVLTNHGGVSPKGDAIVVDHADEATILIAMATNFRGGPIPGGNPAQLCAQMLAAAQKKSYRDLRSAAAAEQRRLMSRISLRLGPHDAALDSLATDERLNRVSKGRDDLGLQEIYFQFARYLLLGSSRPGGMPANLQGLWASGIDNPWGSKWTVNANTEMNYWLAEAANLPECPLPLFDLLDMARQPQTGTASRVAQQYYEVRGFVIHHNLDIWGDSEPIDSYRSGLWPMGGAWLTLHAWDHYAFSGDTVFLRQRAWPLLQNASLFFLDYLVADGEGHLVTGPSLSPENSYKLPDGSAHSLTMGPTMDIEIVRELFQRTLQAGEVLRTDTSFLKRVRAAMDKLPPLKIGKAGQLQEWQEDYDENEPGHRHISHLWALFPGTQITPQHTPELARAARISLERRLANGGGQTGWSRAWVVNYWDHLGQGDEAYKSLQVLFGQSTFPNLMDTHPPGVFQIDGNIGAANGMLEAIVQSRWYPDHCELDLLPALPQQWSQGRLYGVRLRGGAELSMQWSGDHVDSVTLRAMKSTRYDLRLPAGQHLRTLRVGSSPQDFFQDGTGVVRMRTVRGQTYSLEF
jgi:alpha-L-fucosidase 2